MTKKIRIRLPDGSLVDATDGGDVDLDREVLRDKAGRRITETRVTREVEHIERRGRPSLTARGSTSPQVNFRVSASLLAEAEARANAEGKTVSALAREALERLLHAAA